MKLPVQELNFPLSRRSLLKTGSALLLGFTLSPALYAQNRIKAGPPDPEKIDSWIALHSDNTATIYIGFAELGQGCSTALLQVAAEELGLSMRQVKTVGLDTHLTPNQGGTYSSSAIRNGRPQLQRAAAEAKLALLTMAADQLQLPVNSLLVDNGIISGTGDDNVYITYGELVNRLVEGERFELPISGNAPLKPPSEYKIVSKPVPRLDIPLKAAGIYSYMQHQRLPNMLHGRIIRPKGQGAYQDGVQINSVDESSINGINAVLVRQGNFLGVVAEKEWDAVRAAQQLQVEWHRPTRLTGSTYLYREMEFTDTNDHIALDRGDINSVSSNSTYTTKFNANGPYQSHAPFAPNCALADVKQNSALVLCSTQDVYNTRTSIAGLLGLETEQVRVQYHEGAGTFGHSCWDDAAQAAALMSKLSGSPVRVQLMRWDEHGWDNYGPAHVGKVKAAADTNGKIVSYEYHGWQHHWSLIETSEQSATGTEAAEWPAFSAQQINPIVLGGMYDIPNIRLHNHHVPGLPLLKAGWLRSPLDLSFTFVSEQAIDDLAFQTQQDAYQFRRNNISDYHWLGVLDAVAEASNWQNFIPAQSLSDQQIVTGRGIGLGTHLASWGAAVADIEVNQVTGEIRILHLYGAIDAGLVVNTSNVENQIIGQLVQTASRMLYEEVLFDDTSVTSLDWNSYPIQRIADCPEITPVIVQRMDEPSMGAGEEVMAAAAAAIANAFFDATGKRMQMYPFTPTRVQATLSKPA